ncbi:MAG: LPS export ABC transporter periplasmic protein LptC [Acidimicrobiales bacterium]|nr:LPS export ABC transporter periplasmic protein LptC [Hyphomonadaceae bacterium]RZV43783.1 MAG: LPS export ABC transporter periplasmic protein LptC [Acidimicrobiales bacterium]
MSTTSVNDKPNGDGHALQYWEPRRALTLDAARRHSIFVRRARYLLLGFALLLVAMLIWYFINAPKPMTPTGNAEENVKMINPVYKGRTSDSLPYRINADEAVRYFARPDEVNLSNPVLNFLREEGAPESVIVAASGLYNNATQVLELRQEVQLNTDNGYQCQTSHARVFVKSKRIEGDEPISCSGEFGTVLGNAYEINDDYTEFVFKNGMTGHIIPDKTEDILSANETEPQESP